MKRTSLLLSIIALFTFHDATAVTKHALIIAIGNYPSSGGWPHLCSDGDAVFIKNMLVNDSFQDVRTVLDSQATMQGISNAFEQLIHDPAVKKGDVVVIHFSCHGEQVASLDPDKLGGYDQCVVTYNAQYPNLPSDYKKYQADYYRGQTIGSYLQQIRAKLGKDGDVVVFLDYCHSGAGTRGLGKQRGGATPLIPEGFRANDKPANKPTWDVYNTGVKSRGTEDNLATFVAISATRPEESDFETSDENGNDVGSLTYAIGKAFENLDHDMTYRLLFSKIQSVMDKKVPAQHPMIEGNGLDRKLFGGNYVHQKHYIEINDIEKGNQITLKAGILAGLDSGAKVKVYKAGTTDPATRKEVNSGTVVASTSFTSIVQLDQKPGIKTPAEGWVFITEPVYHTKPICIKIVADKKTKTRGANANFTEEDIATIKSSLKELPLITYDQNPELLIVKGPQEDSILMACNGMLLATVPGANQDPQKLKEKIEDYARYKFIKDIDLKNEDANVEVKLVPVINGIADTNNIKNYQVGGVYEFHDKDKIKLLVKNNGKQDVYINILDMQPNGIINPVLPKKSKKIYPVALKINAGQEYLFKDYQITISPPYGAEVFKVFVSSEEIDMEGLATEGEARARGGNEGVRGNLSVMETLLKKANGVATRGTEVDNTANADGTTYNIPFNIVP